MCFFGKLVWIPFFLLIANGSAFSKPITDESHAAFTNADTVYGEKGRIDLKLGIPHINNIRLSPDQNLKMNTGFLGFAVGMDYYYRADVFLNASIHWFSDFFLPFPAAVTYPEEQEFLNPIHINFSNNHKIRNLSFGQSLSFGYGLVIGQNRWRYVIARRSFGADDATVHANERIRQLNYTVMGFHCNMDYKPFKRPKGLFFNAKYHPTIFRFKTIEPTKYEHVISVGFGFHLNMRR